ncbi:hypothetical protein ABEG17_08395 [Pedococcus sp. KACC 23699]|uniref:Uncharacterized protein n=1 Tax=Pedococcus sp. KACC 23699 TaxID=3149228 RepID=A0AAU7JYT5_9MICO
MATPSPEQAQTLAADLSSGDAARVAAAIGAPAAEPANAALAAKLAKAGPLVFSPNVTPVSAGVVTTTATLGSGATKKTWNVRLVLVGGRWVLGTTTLANKP